MNLNDIKARPFVEGTIRAEANPDPARNDRLVFTNTIEILSRHHEAPQGVEGEVPKLAAHPIAQKVAELDHNTAQGRIVEVPVRMFFKSAAKSINIAYQAFSADGVAVCRGNGVTAKRLVMANEGRVETIETECVGADACEYACSGQATCRRQVSMAVQIKGQENPLSVFEVRSTSINTYKTLLGQLTMLEKRFGGLRHIPLKLQLWQASNQLSQYEVFDAFSLALDAPSEIAAMKEAKAMREEETAAGLDADIDSVYASLDQDDAGASDDFVMIQDFYRPIDGSTRTTRRAGSVSVAQKVAENMGQRGSSAKSLIDLALQRAGADSASPLIDSAMPQEAAHAAV